MARIKIDITGNELAIVHTRVRISDINYGNHVGNDSFVSLIHEARVQWLKQHGFTELDIAGTGLIMSDLAIQFSNEAYYGDEIQIIVSTGDISRVSFELYYQVTAERNKVTINLAKARTGMVCFDYQSKKVVAVPSILMDVLKGI